MTAAAEERSGRWAWADVDLDALAHNVDVIRHHAGDADVWAVVKADAYGHGAVAVARAALGAGAAGLCVALTHEGVELRRAGIDAPILLLSEQPVDHAVVIVEHGLTPTVYSASAVDALAAAARRRAPLGVHMKVDTGMQRVGVHVEEAAALAARVRSQPSLRLVGAFTHLAVADSADSADVAFSAEQLARFDQVLQDVDPDHTLVVHAANSAAALAHPPARRRFVRAGIALYGIAPGDGVAELAHHLRPVMSLRARVSFVKPVRAGSRISYGLRHTFEHDTTVATVPIGYADGVPRRLGSIGGDVLVGGARCPIVGVVTMDQLMVDVAPALERQGRPVEVGDEVVLLGEQAEERIRAEDWARLLDTIGYEIVCGVSRRVDRRHRPATP